MVCSAGHLFTPGSGGSARSSVVVRGFWCYSVESDTQSPAGQSPPGQFPLNPLQPLAILCENALRDRVSADAGRRVTLSLYFESPETWTQRDGAGLRGRLRYGVGARDGRTVILRSCRETSPETAWTA